MCPLYFVHRQHPQRISLLHLHLLPFLVAESTDMNNSVLDLLFGLLLSSSESYTSQIMSLHSSCSHKCHCLIRVLVGTTHKKYNLYNLAILQLLPFTTTKPMCVLCVHSSSSPLSLNIKILRFFLLLPYLLTSPST